MMTPDPHRDSFSVPLSVLVIAFLVVVIIGLLAAFVIIEEPMRPREVQIAALSQEVATLQGEIDAIHKANAGQRADFEALGTKSATCEATLASMKKELAAATAEAERQSKRADANLAQCDERLERLRRQLGG